MTRLLPLAAALLLLLPASVGAQDRPPEETEEDAGPTEAEEERLYDALVRDFQTDALRVTALVQVIPRVVLEDEDQGVPTGWTVPRAWLGVGGRLDGGVGYLVRANLASSPGLLDAFVSYGTDDVRAIVGQQLTPFSFEFLTAAAATDFVRRARIVRLLSPGRQVGASVTATPGDGALRLRGGVFNSSAPGANLGGLLVVARAQTTLAVGADGRLVLGANAAYDTPPEGSAGEILLLGADARLRIGRVLLAAEALVREADAVGADARGGHVTAGVDLSPADRVLARLDVLEDSEELVLGYNRTLTRATLVQVELAVPIDDQGGPAQALANFQLAF